MINVLNQEISTSLSYLADQILNYRSWTINLLIINISL